MVRKRLLLWSCACVALLGLAPSAWAQDDPRVDPDSPAGTEYELPIDRARERASPGGPHGTTPAPLFGEGLESRKRGPGSGSNGSPGSDADSSTTSATNEQLGRSTPGPVRAQATTPDSGSGDVVAIGAGAGGVLLLGGLAGLAWRRRSVGR